MNSFELRLAGPEKEGVFSDFGIARPRYRLLASKNLDQPGSTLTSANAHGHDSLLCSAPFAFQQYMTHLPRTCHAVRMPDGNEDIMAFIQPLTGNGLMPDHLKDRLSAYKHPTRWIISDQLSAAPSGKILKARLATVFADELAASSEE